MKIGLLGGTFDPIHLGHIKIAETAILSGEVDRVILIPCGTPVHKTKTFASKEQRLQMAKLAYEGDLITVSSYEIERIEPSYSFDTISEFKRLYPNDEIVFIMGDDAYNEISSWYKSKELLNLCSFLVFTRLGGNISPPAKPLYMPKIEISSSDIRGLIAKSGDASPFLPTRVWQYIAQNKLYTDCLTRG